jgi:hypothetical protein
MSVRPERTGVKGGTGLFFGYFFSRRLYFYFLFRSDRTKYSIFRSDRIIAPALCSLT